MRPASRRVGVVLFACGLAAPAGAIETAAPDGAEAYARALERATGYLFANIPTWRGETIGSHPPVFNAILNFDKLHSPAARP